MIAAISLASHGGCFLAVGSQDKALVTHQLVELSRAKPHLVPSEEHYGMCAA